MLLSAAIIVRNDATHLDGCLSTLGGLVDEIVVVDTGSTDDSIEVARRHGALVIVDPWRDDFSRARNRSVDTANGDWILYVDADERVRGDVGAARDWLALADDCVAALVPFVPRVGWTPYREYRLFRNRGDLRFEGSMHETIVPSLTRIERAEGLRIRPVDGITIEHFGYEGDQSHKYVRDEPLLLGAIERWPRRAYLYDHLARVYEATGDSARAIETWRRGIEQARLHEDNGPGDLLVWVNLIVHLQVYVPTAADLGALLDEAIERFPGTPSLELAAARQAFASQQFEDAARRAEWLLAFDTEAAYDFNSYDKRMFGEWAWELLGLCRFSLGDHAAAAHAFAQAEAAAPDVVEYRVRRQLAEARARR